MKWLKLTSCKQKVERNKIKIQISMLIKGSCSIQYSQYSLQSSLVHGYWHESRFCCFLPSIGHTFYENAVQKLEGISSLKQSFDNILYTSIDRRIHSSLLKAKLWGFFLSYKNIHHHHYHTTSATIDHYSWRMIKQNTLLTHTNTHTHTHTHTHRVS